MMEDELLQCIQPIPEHDYFRFTSFLQQPKRAFQIRGGGTKLTHLRTQ